MKRTKTTANIISIEIHAKSKDGSMIHFKGTTEEGTVKDLVDFLAELYDGVWQSPENPEFDVTSSEYNYNIN